MARKSQVQARARPSRKRAKATTSDVLAAPPPRATKIKPKWKQHCRNLIGLRDYLLTQRENLTQAAQEEKTSFGEHLADAGTDSYDRDFALGMLSSEQNALYEVEEALRRIENGNYGTCELTGKPIQAARLAAVPWTRFSAEAARELEKRGETQRTRLGELGTMAAAADEPESEESDEAR
jgi:RNA polymerase-binding transcription factor DksA